MVYKRQRGDNFVDGPSREFGSNCRCSGRDFLIEAPLSPGSRSARFDELRVHVIRLRDQRRVQRL